MWGSTFLLVLVWFFKIWLRCLWWTLRFVLENCAYYTGIDFWRSRGDKPGPGEPRYRTLKTDKLTSQILFCPEILKVIFQNSDFYRQKTFRLVCKAWNREICLSVSKRNWRVTVHERDVGDLTSLIESRRDGLPLPFESIRLFTIFLPSPVIEQLVGLAAQGLKITNITRISFGETGPTLQKDFHTLLIRLSANLETLHTKSLGDLTAVIPLSFPKLQMLSAVSDENSPYLSSFFLPLIAAAPKLIELHMKGGLLVKDILQQAKLKSLTRLYIKSDEDVVNVNVWKLLGLVDIEALSLLSVEIGLAGYSGDDQDCIKTLSRFASSLTHLDIHRDRVRHGETHPPELPYLPHLTTLVLWNYSPGEFDLRGLPRLRRLKFSQVKFPPTLNNDNQAGISICPSVQSISFMLDILKANSVAASPQEHEAAFLDLFKRFPNAHTWEVGSHNVVSFCRAVLSSGFSVSSLTIRSLMRNPIEEKQILEDRSLLPHVVLLRDLRELEIAERNSGIVWIRELDWKKLPNLEVLKIRSLFKNPAEDYRSLTQHGLKVIIYGPQSVSGSEDLLALKNVEFRVSHKAFSKIKQLLGEAIIKFYNWG